MQSCLSTITPSLLAMILSISTIFYLWPKENLVNNLLNWAILLLIIASKAPPPSKEYLLTPYSSKL